MPNRDREIHDEIEAHLRLAIEERIANGESSEQARRAALLELGNPQLVQEDTRSVWTSSALDSLGQDLRYALRQMRRSPGFSAVVILTLALGIGANTAVFSLLDALMLHPLPVREPGRLVELLSVVPGDPRINSFSPDDYERFRDRNTTLSDLTGIVPAQFRVTSESPEQTVEGGYVLGNFFTTLGMQPSLGRLIEPQDAAAAVISWSYWNSQFQRDPQVIGKQIIANGTSATIVGVAPGDFVGLQIGSKTHLWLSGAFATRPLALIGRLKPGVSIQQAQAELSVLDRPRIERAAADFNNPVWLDGKVELSPAGGGFSQLRDRFGKPLLFVMATAASLLLLSCANLAGMLLARGSSRQREMALRLSLGAGRLRLMRQALVESLVLSVIGSAAGLFVAYFGVGALTRIIASGRRIPGWQGPIEIDVPIDVQLLLFSVGICLLTGLLFGLAPAFCAASGAPVSSLRSQGRSIETRGQRLFGKSLVAAQAAMSVVLLSAAGLFAVHLVSLRNADLGFQRDGLLLLTLDPAESDYQPQQLKALYHQLLADFEAIPGVVSSTHSGTTPINGAAASRFVSVQGFVEPYEARRYVFVNWVGPNFFETYGTHLVAGREFNFPAEPNPQVAIVNESMARYYFGSQDPIGRRFSFERDGVSREIVGVVEDAKYYDLQSAPPRTIYLPSFQPLGVIGNRFTLRTSVALSAVSAEAQRRVSDLLRTVTITEVITMNDQMDASIVPERILTLLSAGFAVLGLMLAAIGLYGLLAYSVARRVPEIGVRLALGATPSLIARKVLLEALALIAAGLAMGIPIAFWARGLAASAIDGLLLSDANPLIVSGLTSIAAALLAAYFPARRAARLDPMTALRED